jgi:hypothetical protein
VAPFVSYGENEVVNLVSDLDHLPAVVLRRLPALLHHSRLRLQGHHVEQLQRASQHLARGDQPVFRQGFEALAAHRQARRRVPCRTAERDGAGEVAVAQ